MFAWILAVAGTALTAVEIFVAERFAPSAVALVVSVVGKLAAVESALA